MAGHPINMTTLTPGLTPSRSQSPASPPRELSPDPPGTSAHSLNTFASKLAWDAQHRRAASPFSSSKASPAGWGNDLALIQARGRERPTAFSPERRGLNLGSTLRREDLDLLEDKLGRDFRLLQDHTTKLVQDVIQPLESKVNAMDNQQMVLRELPPHMQALQDELEQQTRRSDEAEARARRWRHQIESEIKSTWTQMRRELAEISNRGPHSARPQEISNSSHFDKGLSPASLRQELAHMKDSLREDLGRLSLDNVVPTTSDATFITRRELHDAIDRLREEFVQAGMTRRDVQDEIATLRRELSQAADVSASDLRRESHDVTERYREQLADLTEQFTRRMVDTSAELTRIREDVALLKPRDRDRTITSEPVQPAAIQVADSSACLERAISASFGAASHDHRMLVGSRASDVSFGDRDREVSDVAKLAESLAQSMRTAREANEVLVNSIVSASDNAIVSGRADCDNVDFDKMAGRNASLTQAPAVLEEFSQPHWEASLAAVWRAIGELSEHVGEVGGFMARIKGPGATNSVTVPAAEATEALLGVLPAVGHGELATESVTHQSRPQQAGGDAFASVADFSRLSSTVRSQSDELAKLQRQLSDVPIVTSTEITKVSATASTKEELRETFHILEAKLCSNEERLEKKIGELQESVSCVDERVKKCDASERHFEMKHDKLRQELSHLASRIDTCDMSEKPFHARINKLEEAMLCIERNLSKKDDTKGDNSQATQHGHVEAGRDLDSFAQRFVTKEDLSNRLAQMQTKGETSQISEHADKLDTYAQKCDLLADMQKLCDVRVKQLHEEISEVRSRVAKCEEAPSGTIVEAGVLSKTALAKEEDLCNDNIMAREAKFKQELNEQLVEVTAAQEKCRDWCKEHLERLEKRLVARDDAEAKASDGIAASAQGELTERVARCEEANGKVLALGDEVAELRRGYAEMRQELPTLSKRISSCEDELFGEAAAHAAGAVRQAHDFVTSNLRPSIGVSPSPAGGLAQTHSQKREDNEWNFKDQYEGPLCSGRKEKGAEAQPFGSLAPQPSAEQITAPSSMAATSSRSPIQGVIQLPNLENLARAVAARESDTESASRETAPQKDPSSMWESVANVASSSQASKEFLAKRIEESARKGNDDTTDAEEPHAANAARGNK